MNNEVKKEVIDTILDMHTFTAILISKAMKNEDEKEADETYELLSKMTSTLMTMLEIKEDELEDGLMNQVNQLKKSGAIIANNNAEA